MTNENLYLIGPMGAGKTTVGRHLAKKLHRTFYDSDHEITSRAGVDIPRIFEVEGEEGFRKREEQVISELTTLPNIILATGGGVVLSERNRALLAATGIVIYLNVSITQQLNRLKHAKNRPLLLQADPKAILKGLKKIRDPLYRELADFIIKTNRLSPHAIVQDILCKLYS